MTYMPVASMTRPPTLSAPRPTHPTVWGQGEEQVSPATRNLKTPVPAYELRARSTCPVPIQTTFGSDSASATSPMANVDYRHAYHLVLRVGRSATLVGSCPPSHPILSCT